ncbi:MAG: hypothetical protein ACREJ3_19950, partial [Polyangiaceae bacterium]
VSLSWPLISTVLVGAAAVGGCGSAGSGASEFKTEGGVGADGSLGEGGFMFVGPDAANGGGSSGGNGSGGLASGVPSTCIVVTQGCFCDSAGGCAGNLTCTPQSPPRPSLCCVGADCAPSGGSIGSTCGSVPNAASCMPGITIPAATGGNDSCGYPTTSFVESTTLCAINASGGGANPAIVQVFYNDEHALTLGCATSTFPVSALSSDPEALHYPQTGDPACVDAMGRPLRPVLYVTDLTSDPACTAGDQQKGGTPYDPVAIFGTWKSATEGVGNVGTPAMADPMANRWNLTTSGDAVPTVDAGMMTCREGYGTELRFEVGLISGHSYRLQVIAHDGDQNKGGDSGEACAGFCAGSGSLCPQGASEFECGSADASQCPTGSICSEGCCLTPNGGLPTIQ